MFDDGLNPKKDKKPAWRKTLAEFSFKTKKLEKFGSWTTATVFVIPVEGPFAPEGKFGEHLKIEGPELIRLIPQTIHFED